MSYFLDCQFNRVTVHGVQTKNSYSIRMCIRGMLHGRLQRKSSAHILDVCTAFPLKLVYVVCCMGDFKGKAVHTFLMCAHFPDVHTLHSMLRCGQLIISFSHIY